MAKQIIIGMFILKVEFFLKLGIVDTFVPLLHSPRGREFKLSQIYPMKNVVGDLLINEISDSFISMTLLNFRSAFVFSAVSTKCF